MERSDIDPLLSLYDPNAGITIQIMRSRGGGYWCFFVPLTSSLFLFLRSDIIVVPLFALSVVSCKFVNHFHCE